MRAVRIPTVRVPAFVRRLPAVLRQPVAVVGVLLVVAVVVVAITAPGASSRVRSDPTRHVAAAENTITVLGSGDIMAHPPTWDQARKNYAATHGGAQDGYDFEPMFRKVKGAVSSADLAICHLETPLGNPGEAPADFPRFRTPPEMATAIKSAGYDACSTSSNHTLDQGEAGVQSTIRALDAAGIKHTGSYLNAADAVLPTIYVVKGVKVAHLSYAMHFNGLKPPPDKPWMANRIEPKAIHKAAADARAAGAEIVVLSLHWGTEGQHEPDVEQLDWARQIMASPDIDVILGCHTHVVQPFEKVGDKWIVYGMGNTLARHDFPVNDNREGAMPRFTFTKTDGKWRITKAEAIPIWLSLRPEVYVVNVSQALARMSSVDDRRPLYEAAKARIIGHLNSRGAAAAGLIVV